jgi:sigma-B regulation protein RsbU (phosphoserine phosphatase)
VRVRNTGRFAIVFPLALLGVVSLLDAATGKHAVMLGLLVLGPLAAALVLSVTETAVVAAVAVAAAIALGPVDHIWGTADHAVRVFVLASASGIAIYTAHVRALREVALRRIAHVAEVAQEAILRPPPPTIGPVALAARYLSAAEDALIGGDLYETAYTPHGVRIIVGDVRGKGLDAVRLASVVLGCFRSVVFETERLEDVAERLHERVSAELDPEEFVTVVLVELPLTGGVRIVNCGHHPPLRVGPAESSFLVSTTVGTPLGMLDGGWSGDHFDFEAADRILLYTDGLVEARDRGGRFFTLENHVGTLRGNALEDAVEALVQELLLHVGGRLDDDLAVILAERRS